LTIIWKDDDEIRTPASANFLHSNLARMKEYETGGEIIGRKTFDEIRRENPKKYIKKCQLFCCRDNPQTFSYKKKMKVFEEYKCYNFVLEKLEILKNKQFLLKELMMFVDPEEISDGKRQRDILHYQVCLGKIIHNFNDGGKKKPYYTYYYGVKQDVCTFYDNISKKCMFDWTNGKLKEAFND